jgi:hypothetical protein
MKKKELSTTELARKGGQAVLKKYGKEYFSKLRKKGLRKQKRNKKLSTVKS